MQHLAAERLCTPRSLRVVWGQAPRLRAHSNAAFMMTRIAAASRPVTGPAPPASYALVEAGIFESMRIYP